jgi:hypothetical protein
MFCCDPSFERVWRWRLTPLSELPCWELQSRWTPKLSEKDWRGQNTSHWGDLYIIGKPWKCRCLKWVRMAHLNVCDTSYDKKKGRESNWQFDSQPRKVGNRPKFRACRWYATHHWKALDERYNFTLDLVLIRCLSRKLQPRKVARVPTLVVSGLPFGSPGTKNHLDVASVEKCKVYYMGEGGGFLWVWAVMSFVSPKSSWLVLAPKVLQHSINQWVGWLAVDSSE